MIIGCKTVEQLEENVRIAREFSPMSSTDMARLEGLTAGYVGEAQWFKKAPDAAAPAEDDQNMD